MDEAGKKAATIAGGAGLGLSAAAVIWMYSTFGQKSEAEANFKQIRSEIKIVQTFEQEKDNRIFLELQAIKARLDTLFLNQGQQRNDK